MKTQGLFSKTMLGLGFVFLYVPILSMVVFSFNDSRLGDGLESVTSPTLKWYGRLFSDGQILSAAWLSIQVAAMSATGAVVLGTLAGLVLSRFGPFKGRALLQGLTTAPLVMPEVITGLSMLLLFVSLEQLLQCAVRLAVRPRRRDHHHRPHHLHDGLCHGGRAVAPRELRRLAGGGGARPGRAPGQGVLPHHRAADPAGHPVRAGCWPSRFPGTTSWSRSSSPDLGPIRCPWSSFLAFD